MKIAFIGLGNMGSLMSACLVKNGYEVWGYDQIPACVDKAAEANVQKALSPREAVKDARAVVLMLPQSKNTKEAMFGQGGIACELKPGTIVIDMSTSSPTDTKQMCAQLLEQGVHYLDTPVSGGVGKAKTGTLSIMASGDKAAYDEVLPILKAMGEDVFYVGESGNGHTIKLINNMLTGINLAGICEGMVMGMKAGIDPKLLLDIINSSSGESYSSKVKIPNFVFKRDFSGGFKTMLQHKDMALASDLAKDLHVPAAMGNLAKEYYMAAMASGSSDLDASSIVKVLEALTGVEVKPET